MLRLSLVLACLCLAGHCLAGPAGAQAEPSPPAWAVPRSQVIELPPSTAGRHYQAFVKLPAGYGAAENQARIYPVVYLNDGPHTFQVAAGITHLPMNNAQFEDAILVGISFAQGEDAMASRVLDLTQVRDESWSRYETGGAEAYLDYLAASVLPTIEARYRIDASRRILAGHSLGGSFGVYALLERPELFSGYILTSPSLWYSQHEVFDRAERQLDDGRHDGIQLYLAVGEREIPSDGHVRNDMVGDLQALEAILQRHAATGLAFRVEVIGGGATHYTTFPVGLLHGLDWMLGGQAD